ncbi:MAG: thiamine phosphate synthase [Sphingomonadales bacterium]
MKMDSFGRSGATLTEQARRLNFRTARGPGQPKHILLIDGERLVNPAAAIETLPRGSAVILRDYDHPTRLERALWLLGLCRKRGLRLLIGGDGRLAARIRADGLHLPEGLALTALRWRRLRPNWMITSAAHSYPALVRAATARVDAALLSPVFATLSHPHAAAIGPVRFAGLTHKSPVPVYALGGIGPKTVSRLSRCGAVGIAAISGYGESVLEAQMRAEEEDLSVVDFVTQKP